MKTLRECEAGNIVQVYLRQTVCRVAENEGEMGPTSQVIPALIIRAMDRNSLVLLAWKENEIRPDNAWVAGVDKGKDILDRGYQYGRFVSADTPVLLTVVAGMHCSGRHCNEYNDYAVPNSKDGKRFYCYRCRQGGYHLLDE